MRLAVIPGDGIGPEVIDEALKVLNEVSPGAETTTYDLGAARWHSTGELLPESVLTELREHDAILLGAVGDPSVPSGILERGLLLRLRFELDHHVNLRPARLYPGVRGPLAGKSEIDMVVVREGTEGPYVGTGGLLRKDTPQEIATEVSVNTAFGVERVVRDAFDRAERRPRKHLTLVHKTNVLTYSGRLWSRLVEEVSLEHPEVSVAYQHIDATTIHMVHRPVPVRRDRHRQPVRRHPDRPGRRGERRDRARGQRQPGRQPAQPEHVRAGARQRAGHRRAGHRRPDGRGAVGGAAARPPRRPASAGRIEAAVAFDLATRDHSATGHTQSIGDRLAALVSAHATSDA